MAVEGKRGCGYRKVNGIYLVGSGMSIGCGRLPFNLLVCPTCNQGIHPALGWTWVDGIKLLSPNCKEDHDCHEFGCAICNPQELGRCGLMWVGAKFYSPDEFSKEAATMGISKRIAAIPQMFEIGNTWVLLAHKEGGIKKVENKNTLTGFRSEKCPAIFYAFKPTRIEKILRQSDATPEEIEKLNKRGITVVTVPDNDKDHQGTVYDKEEEPEEEQPKLKQKSLNELSKPEPEIKTPIKTRERAKVGLVREKKMYVDKWICPKCSSNQVTLRYKTSVGRKVRSYCSDCRTQSRIITGYFSNKEQD